jgi:hypothetical protein
VAAYCLGLRPKDKQQNSPGKTGPGRCQVLFQACCFSISPYQRKWLRSVVRATEGLSCNDPAARARLERTVSPDEPCEFKQLSLFLSLPVLIHCHTTTLGQQGVQPAPDRVKCEAIGSGFGLDSAERCHQHRIKNFNYSALFHRCI